MSVNVSIVAGPIQETEYSPPLDGAGAELSFRGIVRPYEAGRPIVGLEYEVYEPMVQKLLAELCAQAIHRFGVLSIRLIHSKAFVPAGEVSLLINIRSERRIAALESMTWLIEALKREVPIWKHAVAERCEENLAEIRSASGGCGAKGCAP